MCPKMVPQKKSTTCPTNNEPSRSSDDEKTCKLEKLNPPKHNKYNSFCKKQAFLQLCGKIKKIMALGRQGGKNEN